MKILLLFLALSFSLLAGDTATTINRPSYLGGGSVTTVQSGGNTTKVVVTARPSYLGGGSNVKVSSGGKTTGSATIVVKPVYLGGGSTIKSK